MGEQGGCQAPARLIANPAAHFHATPFRQLPAPKSTHGNRVSNQLVSFYPFRDGLVLRRIFLLVIV